MTPKQILFDGKVIGVITLEYKLFTLLVGGDQFDELLFVLRRGMNTMDPIPPWLNHIFEECQENPVPPLVGRATK